MTRPDDDYEDDRPHRRERFVDDDYDDDPEWPQERRARREMTWADKQFTSTALPLLVFFSLCCAGIALVFGIVGLATCKDPQAKRNALIVTIISACMAAVGTVIQIILALHDLP